MSVADSRHTSSLEEHQEHQCGKISKSTAVDDSSSTRNQKVMSVLDILSVFKALPCCHAALIEGRPQLLSLKALSLATRLLCWNCYFYFLTLINHLNWNNTRVTSLLWKCKYSVLIRPCYIGHTQTRSYCKSGVYCSQERYELWKRNTRVRRASIDSGAGGVDSAQFATNPKHHRFSLTWPSCP